MSKVIAIDPGKSKCGLVVADIKKKKVYEAISYQKPFTFEYT